jgi:hypothetical protein
MVLTSLNGSRQIECSSDAKTRLLHRIRATLIKGVVDEQETFRKRSVAGHNLRSRTSALCIISPPLLHGEQAFREIQNGRCRDFRMALDGAGSSARRPVSGGGPIVHPFSQLCQSRRSVPDETGAWPQTNYGFCG